MHYWYKKYYISITLQHYIATCINWVPRLTVQFRLINVLSKHNSFVYRGLTVLYKSNIYK